MERRTVSARIALAEAHEKESGGAPVLDPDFAADVDEIVRNRKSVEPAEVGLILDSGVVIAGERRGRTSSGRSWNSLEATTERPKSVYPW